MRVMSSTTRSSFEAKGEAESECSAMGMFAASAVGAAVVRMPGFEVEAGAVMAVVVAWEAASERRSQQTITEMSVRNDIPEMVGKGALAKSMLSAAKEVATNGRGAPKTTEARRTSTETRLIVECMLKRRWLDRSRRCQRVVEVLDGGWWVTM
jgi:hypothetical protein